MAELYQSDATSHAAPPAKPPPDLPGVGDLSPAWQVQLSLSQIRAGLSVLAAAAAGAGITLSTPDDVSAKVQADASADEIKLAILAFHESLIQELNAADFRLGKAYGLGRALADTTLEPSADDPATYEYAFDEFRVRTMVEWLNDLHSVFPDHAAPAVCRSLLAWEGWVANPVFDGKPTTLPQAGQRLTRALRAQGRVWRSLLSGEKVPEDLLSTGDYLGAAVGLVSDLCSLAWALLKHLWLSVLGLIAAAGGGFWLIFHYLSGSSKTAAAIVAILGWLGISWRSVSSTLGKAMGRLEQPAWNAELEAAIALAATHLPHPVPADHQEAPSAPPPKLPTAAWINKPTPQEDAH